MLALITGRGALPAVLAAAQGTRPLICALKGHAPDGLAPDIIFRIEHLGSLLATLKARGVTQVCFCGAIERPQIDPDQVDAATMPLVPVLAKAVAGGEDRALRAVLGLFEDAGFAVRAAQDLAPDLLRPAGTLTTAPVPAQAEAEVAVALRVLAAHGAADLGQACVIQNGSVRACEDARGTDAMLVDLTTPMAASFAGVPDPLSGLMDMAGDMLGGAAGWLSGDAAQGSARAGLLFKGPKPGQDLRIDLPTIGPVTAERVAAAGLAGIVIVQGGVLVLDRARVVEILNAAGLYLWVR